MLENESSSPTSSAHLNKGGQRMAFTDKSPIKLAKTLRCEKSLLVVTKAAAQSSTLIQIL